MAHFRNALSTELSPQSAGLAGSFRGAPPATPLVLLASLGAHVLGAIALGALPAGNLVLRAEERVAVSLTAPSTPPPPPAALAPEPVPERVVPEPTRPRTPGPVAAAPEPEATEPLEPAAPTTAAPPSVDDVFGDPPPAPAVLAGSGGTGPAVTVGTGPAGGASGGTGTTLGAGSGGSEHDTMEDASARRRARLAYKRELERLLRSRTSYPRAALRERLGGRVELALRIGHDGAVLGVRVAESSGFSLLDDAAVASARVDRVPAPPEEAGLRESDELLVGLVYVVR